MKATFPADAVGIHESNISFWCGWSTWMQHYGKLLGTHVDAWGCKTFHYQVCISFRYWHCSSFFPSGSWDAAAGKRGFSNQGNTTVTTIGLQIRAGVGFLVGPPTCGAKANEQGYAVSQDDLWQASVNGQPDPTSDWIWSMAPPGLRAAAAAACRWVINT